MVSGYGRVPIETYGDVTLNSQSPDTCVPHKIKFTATKTGSTPLFSLQTSVQLGLIFKKPTDYVSAFTDEAAVYAKEPCTICMGNPRRPSTLMKLGYVAQRVILIKSFHGHYEIPYAVSEIFAVLRAKIEVSLVGPLSGATRALPGWSYLGGDKTTRAGNDE